MTSEEMRNSKAKPGYWFENISKLGCEPKWVEVPVPHVEKDNLFGYGIKEFMAKQYK